MRRPFVLSQTFSVILSLFVTQFMETIATISVQGGSGTFWLELCVYIKLQNIFDHNYVYVFNHSTIFYRKSWILH